MYASPRLFIPPHWVSECIRVEGANGENETNELAQLSTEDSDPAGYAVSAGLGIRPGLSRRLGRSLTRPLLPLCFSF